MRATSCKPVVGLVPRQESVRCAIPSSRARRFTAAASRFASGRSPWSTVTARSFGARCRRFLRSLAQRAAMTSSAVESEPPETASRSPRKPSRPLNSALTSASRTAWSAMATLLFSVHGLFYARRCARVFAQHLAERSASRFLLAQGRERLAKPQQRLRRPRRGLVFGGDGEERFGGVAILLLLEQTFAEPVLSLRRQVIARILAQKATETFGREHVILAQNVAIGEVVLVPGRISRRQRRLHGAGAARIARRRRRQLAGWPRR